MFRHIELVFLFLALCLFTPSTCQFDEDQCFTPSNQPGDCINLVNCQPLLQQLSSSPRPVPRPLRELLLASQCGFEGTRPKVCCPRQGFSTSRPVAPPVTSRPNPNPGNLGGSAAPPPPDVSNHPNLNLLPPDCGELSDDRVYGGNKTGLFEFPWMALIAYNTRRGLSFQCGATVINDRYILTAAHCLTGLSEGNTIAGVRVGEHDINKEQDCEGSTLSRVCAPPVQDFPVERIIIHPEYSSTQLRHDIGLVRLGGQIDLSQYNARPICLPVYRELSTLNLNNRSIVVTGWGATENGVPQSPDLLKVNLPIVDNQRCTQIHNRSVPGGISYTQICAGGIEGVDSCGGDSGGPLQLPGYYGNTNRFVQHGIVSFGPRRCGTFGIPGVYTRVAYYMDWILNQLQP